MNCSFGLNLCRLCPQSTSKLYFTSKNHCQEVRSVSAEIIRQILTPQTPTDPNSLVKYLAKNVLYYKEGQILVVSKPYGISSFGFRSNEGILFGGGKRIEGRKIINDWSENNNEDIEIKTDLLPLSIKKVMSHLAAAFQEPQLIFATGLKRYYSGPVFFAMNKKILDKIRLSLSRASSRIKMDGGNFNILAVCVGRPEHEEGEIIGYASYLNSNGKLEYQFTEKVIENRNLLRSKQAIRGSCRYKVIAAGHQCSLIDLQVDKFGRHLPRLMLTQLCCPALGDALYRHRVSMIMDHPVLVLPRNAANAIQYLPNELLRHLGISSNDYINRLPLCMHVYRSTLPKFTGNTGDLVVSAPPPTHLIALIEALGWTKEAAKYLSNKCSPPDIHDKCHQ